MGNAIVVAAYTVAFIILGEEKQYGWLWVPALVLVVQAAFNWLLLVKDRGVPILLRAMYDRLEIPKDDNLTCTVLVRSKLWPETLVQKERYSPTTTTTSRSKIRLSQGVAGRAYRTRQVQLETFDNYTEELIEKWGFNQREAGQFRRDRKSILCVPIVDPNNEEHVLGVLSLDTNNTTSFSANQHIPRVKEFTPYFTLLLAPGTRRH